jgi:hypothetical protein
MAVSQAGRGGREATRVGRAATVDWLAVCRDMLRSRLMAAVLPAVERIRTAMQGLVAY